MSHERYVKFAAAYIIGIVEDKDGKDPVIGIISNDESIAEALIKDIERKTGTKSEPFEDFFTGQSKTFGFTSWKGSSWVPEGPKPNWVPPGKKLN